MAVIVTRPYDGITLNGEMRQALVESPDSEVEKVFPNELAARQFLLDAGILPADLDMFEYVDESEWIRMKEDSI
jgi:hypothetical protein